MRDLLSDVSNYAWPTKYSSYMRHIW